MFYSKFRKVVKIINSSRLSFSRALLFTSMLSVLQTNALLAGKDDLLQGGSDDESKKTQFERRSSLDKVEDQRQPVKLLVDSELTEKARDLGYWGRVLDQIGHKMTSFLPARNFGLVALRNVNVNGFGTSLIVIDVDFETDASTNFLFPENFMFEPGEERTNDTVKLRRMVKPDSLKNTTPIKLKLTSCFHLQNNKVRMVISRAV